MPALCTLSQKDAPLCDNSSQAFGVHCLRNIQSPRVRSKMGIAAPRTSDSLHSVFSVSTFTPAWSEWQIRSLQSRYSTKLLTFSKYSAIVARENRPSHLPACPPSVKSFACHTSKDCSYKSSFCFLCCQASRAKPFVFNESISLFLRSFHSCARKSFACHSYEKYPGVPPPKLPAFQNGKGAALLCQPRCLPFLATRLHFHQVPS